MNLDLNKNIKQIKQKFPHWKTRSKIVGEAVEEWAVENLECPFCHKTKCCSCNESTLKKLPASHKSADLVCVNCKTKIQIKAKKGSFFTKDGRLKKIIGAEYTTTVNSLQNSKIHYYLIAYDRHMKINEVFHIKPKSIKPNVVIPRKPLQKPAKRAGWQGCYIKFEEESLNKKQVCEQLSFWP